MGHSPRGSRIPAVWKVKAALADLDAPEGNYFFVIRATTAAGNVRIEQYDGSVVTLAIPKDADFYVTARKILNTGTTATGLIAGLE